MTNDEYIQYRRRGRKIFEDKVQEKNVEKIMSERWNDIRNFPYKTYQEIKDWQLKRIAELVDYAYLNIPLYKKKYDTIGYHVGDIKSWDDYDKLPMLYKEELIEGFPDDIVKDVEDYIFSTRSSGSSGRFVTIAVSKDAIFEDTIQGFRQYYIQSNNNYENTDTVLFIYTCPWWIQSVNGKYKAEFLPTTTKIKDAIEFIKRIRPKIISTYPTYLERIAATDIKLDEYGVDTVIVHSEQSNPLQRELLSKKLSVNVVDEYSSEELTRIALECHYHNYHIEEDACYIETYNPNTLKKCEYGESGIIVGTNLLNTSTPIIKYWQGDLAVIDKPVQCKCKNNCRTLKKINGRFMDSIVTPGGDIIAASAFMDLAYNWFLEFEIPVHGLRYQFIQETKDTLDLYLITGTFQIDFDKIRESVYSLIPSDIRLNIKCVDEVPINAQKYRPVINRINK